ncbi:uncharacterized protein METZ01_LOCUS416225, partial [marine metagenome]
MHHTIEPHVFAESCVTNFECKSGISSPSKTLREGNMAVKHWPQESARTIRSK